MSTNNMFDVLDHDGEKVLVNTEGSGASVLELVASPQLPSGCSPDVKEKLVQSLSVLIDFCTLYGFDQTRFDRRSTLLHWQSCSVECGWMKFLKYKTSAFFSDYLDLEIPEKPFSCDDSPAFLAGGALGRFMRKVMRNPDVKFTTQFACGVLFLKKGMPRPDKPLLDIALAKTKEMLTTPHPCPPSQFLSRPQLLSELVRTTREVFGRAQMTEDDLYRPYAPSIRANVTDSRSEFGTLGTLVDRGLLEQPVSLLPSYDEFAWEGMNVERYLQMGEDFRRVNERNLYGKVFEDVNDDEDEIDMEERPHKELSPVFKDKVKNLYVELYRNAVEIAMEEKPDVKLVALPESLKVRVISKGPALTYFVLKPVQKFLHKHLRRLKMFQYTGKPVTAEDLTQVLFPRPLTEAQSTDPMLGLLFHSLDYKSATDLFDPEISRAIVDAICDCVFVKLPVHLSRVLRSLFHTALTGHMVEGSPQVWGQLMGSIVSFIVLCIANAAVIRSSYEISENTVVSLESCPATANGDDGLVVASAKFAEVWRSVSASAGLKPSVGKTYSHFAYANINSTSFVWDDERFRLDHIPYVNMGLVYGLKRSGGAADVVTEDGEDTEFAASIGAIHTTLLDSCPSGMELKVHELFLQHNRTRLSTVFVPWYVPEKMGGLGMRTVYDVSDWDVDNVKVIAGPTLSDKRCLSLLPSLTGLRPQKLPSSQPILCRSLWSSLLQSCRLSSAASGFLDTATFYLLPMSVMKQKPFDHSRLRRNERAWALLRRLSRTA